MVSTPLTIRVCKAPIIACLTCPLCGDLFREATTISECLHTFCKECIHERLNDEESTTCPMCSVDLGTAPEEKLRPDPQLDDVQAKIFGSSLNKRPAARSPVALSPPTYNTALRRRRDRALSSLGLQSTSASRSRRRKSWVVEESEDEYDEDSGGTAQGDDDMNSLDSAGEGPGTSKKRRRLSCNDSTDSKQQGGELSALARLADLADDQSPSDKRARAKGASLRATKNVRRSSQLSNGHPARSPGIWFALKTAKSESGGIDLPQIKAPYLKIKDGKITVSTVKKYLAQKLDLNEAELEVTCRGQPLVSSLPLENVKNIWLASQESRGGQASSTGQEFMMVLTYSRRASASQCA